MEIAMEKYIYNEQNGLHYELVGDYYYPCLAAPEPVQISIWGMRRYKYLRAHKKVLCINLLTTGKLNKHLEKDNHSVEEMLDRLVKQLMTIEGVTERLKQQDQMTWVARINNIYTRAKEIVLQELIYE